MMHKIIQCFTRIVLIIALIIPIFNPLTTKAYSDKTIADLREELQKLKDEKARIESSKQLTQDQINAAKNSIFQAQKEQDQIAKDIETAKQKITESEKMIEQLTQETEALLRYFQLTKGDNVYNEYLADATSLKDLIRRLAAVEQIPEYSQDTLKKLDDLITENEQLQVELKEKTTELDKKIAETASKMQQLNGQYSEYSEINADIDAQIKNQQEQINYFKQICSSETIPISSCGNSIGNSAGWTKPLAKGTVTSNWGYRIDPITGAASSFHNAVDIGGNPEGTNIYAAAAGRVSNIDYKTSCGGNIVYIHTMVNGVKYTMQYAHMLSVKVNKGDMVTTSTVIGTVGGGRSTYWDHCSTGAHLHFGISKGYYGIDYSSWNSFLANSIKPPGYPSKGIWWYSR